MRHGSPTQTISPERQREIQRERRNSPEAKDRRKSRQKDEIAKIKAQAAAQAAKDYSPHTRPLGLIPEANALNQRNQERDSKEGGGGKGKQVGFQYQPPPPPKQLVASKMSMLEMMELEQRMEERRLAEGGGEEGEEGAAAPSSSTEAAPAFAPAMTRADSGQHSQGFRSGFHGKDVDLLSGLLSPRSQRIQKEVEEKADEERAQLLEGMTEEERRHTRRKRRGAMLRLRRWRCDYSRRRRELRRRRRPHEPRSYSKLLAKGLIRTPCFDQYSRRPRSARIGAGSR